MFFIIRIFITCFYFIINSDSTNIEIQIEGCQEKI